MATLVLASLYGEPTSSLEEHSNVYIAWFAGAMGVLNLVLLPMALYENAYSLFFSSCGQESGELKMKEHDAFKYENYSINFMPLGIVGKMRKNIY